MSEKKCVICQELAGENFVNLGCCKQKCCINCFVTWMRINNTCPTCRHVHAEKPVEQSRKTGTTFITMSQLQEIAQKCWDDNWHLMEGKDTDTIQLAVDLSKHMATSMKTWVNNNLVN